MPASSSEMPTKHRLLSGLSALRIRRKEVDLLLKPIFIGYKVAIAHGVPHHTRCFPFLSSVDATLDPQALAQEMIHEPYRYRRRHPDGLFLGP